MGFCEAVFVVICLCLKVGSKFIEICLPLPVLGLKVRNAHAWLLSLFPFLPLLIPYAVPRICQASVGLQWPMWMVGCVESV